MTGEQAEQAARLLRTRRGAVHEERASEPHRTVARVDLLITGASGFIGGHLVRYWRGTHRLYALGRRPVDGTIHIACDLEQGMDPATLPDHVDAVVHLATAQTDPAAIRRVNVGATGELLGAARDRGARCFVLASSGAVYGWRDDDASEDTPLAPPDAYTRAKVAAEELVKTSGDALDTAIFRLYMPYGSG